MLIEEKKYKVVSAVFINDTDGRVNIGCRLTSQTLKKTLIEKYLERGFYLKINSVPYLFRKNKNERNSCFSEQKTLSLEDGSSLRTWLVSLALAEYGENSIGALLDADIVYFQPEGTLGQNDTFQTISGFLSLPLLAILIGKKIICLNGTFPKYNGVARKIVEFIIDNSIIASARDRLTSEYYNCPLIPDSAFAYDVPSQKNSQKSYALITTGARNEQETDISILLAALDFSKATNLAPYVLSKNSQNICSFKDKILELGGDFQETATLEDASKIIQKCAIHIGGRYHMAILCSLLGVPSLLYNVETGKNLWLSQEITIIDCFNNCDALILRARALYEKAIITNWAVPFELIGLRTSFFRGMDRVVERSLGVREENLRHIFRWKQKSI